MKKQKKTNIWRVKLELLKLKEAPKKKPAEGEETPDEVVVEEEIDEDANDPVRLWEDGWKQRYYKIKFNVEEEDVEFRRKIVSYSRKF